jgi:hypothetical protein
VNINVKTLIVLLNTALHRQPAKHKSESHFFLVSFGELCILKVGAMIIFTCISGVRTTEKYEMTVLMGKSQANCFQELLKQKHVHEAFILKSSTAWTQGVGYLNLELM